MRGVETPGRIVTNFCTGVGVHDVITCADLYYDRLRCVGVAGVKFWLSPLTCFVALTTLIFYLTVILFHTLVKLKCDHLYGE